MPTLWVWAIFALSMTVLAASMLTWREGRRFGSRALVPSEERVVRAAIELLATQPGGANARSILTPMLTQHRVRAMDRFTFARAEERNAFGYTDERGRILLNPHLCFAYQRTLSPRLLKGIADADLVATLATLHHEIHHLLEGASEESAYEDEWRFVHRLRGWCDTQHRPALAGELLDWEQHLMPRVCLHVGPRAAEKIRQRVETLP